MKAIPCLAFAGYSIWSLTTPPEPLVGLFELFVAQFWLYGGVAYLFAAFLLARRSFAWRLTGGLIDATATAIVAGVILWIDEPSLTAVYSCCQGDPRVIGPAIVALIAVAWIAASLPMMAWLIRDSAARFQQRRQRV